MRRVVFLSLLLIAAILGGCDDVTGISGGRDVEGRWSGSVDREDIYLTLVEDNGRIHGSGTWGPDAMTVEAVWVSQWSRPESSPSRMWMTS